MARRKMYQVFTPHVDHPGTRAQPYLKPALDQGKLQLVGMLIPKAIQKVNKRGVGESYDIKLYDALDEAVRAAAFYVLQRAQRLAPVKTRRLAGSLTVDRRGILTFTVGTNVAYAPYVELGTRPHPIDPRRRLVLAFLGKRPQISKGKRKK